MAEILVIVAHPQMEHSRINRALMQAASTLPEDRVLVRDLYHLYPDYLIDIATEQKLLAEARLIVWQHPMHWYGMPPLMKLWLDEVFAFGWAYGHGTRALEGRDLWLAISTGGTEEAYHPSGHNRHFIDAFFPPYEQTAALAGLRFLPPLVLHGAHRTGEAELAEHAALYAQRLGSYPQWPELDELEVEPVCEVPDSDRPHDDDAFPAAA